MSDVERWETEVRVARRALREAEDSLGDARLDAAPVKVGDVVRTARGELIRVTNIVTRSHGWLDMSGNPKKQNDEWSKAVRNVYGGWELVEGADGRVARPPEEG